MSIMVTSVVALPSAVLTVNPMAPPWVTKLCGSDLGNSCRTGSLETITCQACDIHLIIQWIGNDHVLFRQSGRTGFCSCQVDFLTLSNPAVRRHLVCPYRCERQGQRVNLGILILREFEQSLVNGLAIASLGSIVNEAAPATVQHTETVVDTFGIESGVHAVLRQTERIGL